ncbi:MAG: TIGR03936 family radical SAM-associated protein [Acidimicrobiia bacterium]
MWVRIRWTKVGKIRWTSHRDAARIWERAMRRAELPMIYSEGFSPRARMSFGLALPTGSESLAEFLDVDLTDGEALDLDTIPQRLSACLPFGMTVLEAAAVPRGAESAQADAVACDWVIDIDNVTLDEANDAVASLLAAESRVITKRRKDQIVTDDIRPGVESLVVTGLSADGKSVLVRAVLGTKPRGIRPGDLITGLFPGNDNVVERRSLRVAQLIERAGERHTLRAAPHMAAA